MLRLQILWAAICVASKPSHSWPDSTQFTKFSSNYTLEATHIWSNYSFEASQPNVTSLLKCGAICLQEPPCQGFQMHFMLFKSTKRGHELCQLFNYTVNIQDITLKSRGVQIFVRLADQPTSQTPTPARYVSRSTTPSDDDKSEEDKYDYDNDSSEEDDD